MTFKNSVYGKCDQTYLGYNPDFFFYLLCTLVKLLNISGPHFPYLNIRVMLVLVVPPRLVVKTQ